MKLKAYLFKVLSICIGVVLGLFLGIIVFGTVIRIFFDLLFHWGDSGPEWVNWLIVIITAVFIFLCSYISVRWMKSKTEGHGEE